MSLFLSTLSLRRATVCASIRIASNLYFYPRSPCGERHKTAELIINVRYFYPRSPCGERPELLTACAAIASISIHALLAESDTFEEVPTNEEQTISIHALLAESDLKTP